MSTASNFPVLLEHFFIQRLMQQRRVSPHTIASYRDTFRLLLRFVQAKLHKEPSQLQFEQLDAPLIAEFLDDLEKSHGITSRSRNLRLQRFAPSSAMPPLKHLPIPRKSNVCWRFPASGARAPKWDS